MVDSQVRTLLERLTRLSSSMMETIRSAHSPDGITSGCFRYSRRSVNAAFFLTNVCETLRERRDRRGRVCQKCRERGEARPPAEGRGGLTAR